MCQLFTDCGPSLGANLSLVPRFLKAELLLSLFSCSSLEHMQRWSSQEARAPSFLFSVVI